jgi:hypothetical protein
MKSMPSESASPRLRLEHRTCAAGAPHRLGTHHQHEDEGRRAQCPLARVSAVVSRHVDQIEGI